MRVSSNLFLTSLGICLGQILIALFRISISPMKSTLSGVNFSLPASLIRLPCFEKITSANVYVETAKALLKSKSILSLIDLQR